MFESRTHFLAVHMLHLKKKKGDFDYSFYAGMVFTNLVGRISFCPYRYWELTPGFIVCLKETNCCIRLKDLQLGGNLFMYGVSVQIQGRYRMSPCLCIVACDCFCQKYVNGYLPEVNGESRPMMFTK